MSADAEYRQFCKILPTLSPRQLSEARKKINVLLAITGTGEDGEKQSDDDWLLDGIIVELQSRGQGKLIPPYTMIRRMNQYKTYTRQALQLRFWLEAAVPGLRPVEKRALGILVARSYARYLEPWAEVSLGSCLQLIQHLSEAVDRAFPGYVASGMLGALVRKELSTMRQED